ncbi:hypothetical protein D3C71_1336530 [compost metagenome]
MARRATFPMRNALKLQALFKTGQLQVRGGYVDTRYRDAGHDPAGGRFHTRLRGTNGETTQRSDYLINATSFSVDVARTDDPLIATLLRDGHARADPFGGLALDFNTGCLKTAQDAVLGQVSVLGSLAGGTYFWTTSMDVNARLARDQAVRIATALARPTRITDPDSLADTPSLAKWTAHRPTHPAPTASS